MAARILTVGEERQKYQKEERLENTMWYWIRVDDSSVTSWFSAI